jgi:hypothetical protein
MKEAWNWDESQRAVIQSAPNARILVDAGPGTGKTAVACGRVAWLIDHMGISPNNIWLISFTRTAVQEIRNRIGEFLVNGSDVYSVRIATLDSHAWMIHSGFDRNSELLGSYDENIRELTRKIKEDRQGLISEYLQTVEHLIVDEAQDIVGIRADLVMEIVRRLPENCGITIFSDAAQAIYGFSLDEEVREIKERQKTLPEKIVDEYGNDFTEFQLLKVFRTDLPRLKRLYTSLRKEVMKPADNPHQKYNDIHQGIQDLANLKKIDPVNPRHIFPNNCLILYRRRSEVLLAAHNIGNPHRIRMSGLPVAIYPWVGACLGEFTERRLTKKTFDDLWGTLINKNQISDGISSETAWAQLIQIAGESNTVVDMKMLRQYLGRSKPPAEFTLPEIGITGPILGTIHASKGREADQVRLMLPTRKKEGSGLNSDYEEETRVIFVGASRAKKWLGVGSGYTWPFSRSLESGRVYAPGKKAGIARVEIGRENDLTASGIAGSNYYRDPERIRENQEKIGKIDGKKYLKAMGLKDASCDYIYRVIPEGETEDICAFDSPLLRNDLFQIAKSIQGYNLRPPDELPDLLIYGARTIVLPPDSPVCRTLSEPWSQSGIMLAPIILGYPSVMFPFPRVREK